MPAEILSADESVGTPASHRFTYECSKHTVSGNVVQDEAIRVCHQQKPRLKSRGWNRSPVDSLESRFWWARWHLLPLLALHLRRPPTNFVTVSWRNGITPRLLADFWKRIGRSVREFNNRFEELRFFGVLEINAENIVHAHLLVRTELKTDAVSELLESRIRSLSAGSAALTYCDEVRSDEAVSRYSLKSLNDVRTGEKDVLLFEKGLARLKMQSCYFKPWTVPELRKEGHAIERARREKWHRDNGGQFPSGSIVLDSAAEKLVRHGHGGVLLIPG